MEKTIRLQHGRLSPFFLFFFTLLSFLFLTFYLFFGLHWVFVALLSLVAASRSCSLGVRLPSEVTSLVGAQTLGAQA